jgi:hypothetical protein
VTAPPASPLKGIFNFAHLPRRDVLRSGTAIAPDPDRTFSVSIMESATSVNQHPEIDMMRRYWRALRDGEFALTGNPPSDAINRRLGLSVVVQKLANGTMPIRIAGTMFKYYHARATEGEDFISFWRPIEQPMLIAAIQNALTARAPVFLVTGARNANSESACFHMMLAPLRGVSGEVNALMATLAPASSTRIFVDYPIVEHAILSMRAATVSKAPPPRAALFAMQIAAAAIKAPKSG